MKPKFKHTPGPWIYTGGKILADWKENEYQEDPTEVLNLMAAMGGKDIEADARLIASAPDLLNALDLIRSILQEWDAGTGKYKNLINHAETAINKAI